MVMRDQMYEVDSNGGCVHFNEVALHFVETTSLLDWQNVEITLNAR